MLNNQAKKDLLKLYKEINTNPDAQLFWSVLECAGCAEEFKEFIEHTEERNKTE